MVSSVKAPKESSFDVLQTIVNERRNYGPLEDFYDQVSPHLFAQYQLYVENKGNPESVYQFDLLKFLGGDRAELDKRKKTLLNLYSPKEHQSPYAILKRMRRKHQLLCCPSCGEDGTPGTLDHYLPKDDFPEFAACLMNLTPMCNRCQEEKSTNYLTAKGQKAYFHPYFDNINESYFLVDIFPPYDTPTFKVKIARGEPKSIRLLMSHLKGIDFMERFHVFCEAKHIHLLKIMAGRSLQKDPHSVESMINLFLLPELEKSVNSWDAIYYSSVLENQKLLEYLDSGKLPDYMLPGDR
jgi:hypothetical protein